MSTATIHAALLRFVKHSCPMEPHCLAHDLSRWWCILWNSVEAHYELTRVHALCFSLWHGWLQIWRSPTSGTSQPAPCGKRQCSFIFISSFWVLATRCWFSRWQALWSLPRPPQQDTVQSTNFSGKRGGVAILYKRFLQFQSAPAFLQQDYPPLHTYRFLHGILSIDHGHTVRFMSVYGFIGADVHQDAKTLSDTFFQPVFDYAAQVGTTPISI